MCKHLFSPVYTTSRIPRIRGGICIIERKSIFECARLHFLVVLLFFICHPKMYSFSVCNSWEGRGMLNKFVATNINATRYVYFCYTWIAWWRVPSTFPPISHSASSFRWPSQSFHFAPSFGLSFFLDVFVFPGVFSMHFIVWLLLGKLSLKSCSLLFRTVNLKYCIWFIWYVPEKEKEMFSVWHLREAELNLRHYTTALQASSPAFFHCVIDTCLSFELTHRYQLLLTFR